MSRQVFNRKVCFEQLQNCNSAVIKYVSSIMHFANTCKNYITKFFDNNWTCALKNNRGRGVRNNIIWRLIPKRERTLRATWRISTDCLRTTQAREHFYAWRKQRSEMHTGKIIVFFILLVVIFRLFVSYVYCIMLALYYKMTFTKIIYSVERAVTCIFCKRALGFTFNSPLSPLTCCRPLRRLKRKWSGISSYFSNAPEFSYGKETFLANLSRTRDGKHAWNADKMN